MTGGYTTKKYPIRHPNIIKYPELSQTKNTFIPLTYLFLPCFPHRPIVRIVAPPMWYASTMLLDLTSAGHSAAGRTPHRSPVERWPVVFFMRWSKESKDREMLNTSIWRHEQEILSHNYSHWIRERWKSLNTISDQIYHHIFHIEQFYHPTFKTH